jgi:methyltransferase (TIGR00027 family)
LAQLESTPHYKLAAVVTASGPKAAAKESERPDALFRDPLSLKLAGERGQRIMMDLWGSNWAGAPHARIMIWQVALRTHIIDRFIETAIGQGTDAILNLGAGLDTRPYRMAVPNTLQWIEVDYPHVIDLKDSELSAEHPRCNLERISSVRCIYPLPGHFG